MIRITSAVILSCLLVGCSPVSYKKPPMNDPSDDANIKLAEAASSVSESMREVAKIEKVVIPPKTGNHATIPDAPNLSARASVDWNGPIAELADRIAKAAHYKLRILGNEPSIPILISLIAKDESLATLLRDIDYQAGKRASLYVYPKTQVLELRYAKMYS